LAAERKRQEDEAREREQKRIAAERQRLEDEARERDRQRAIEEQQLRGRKARQREAREREEDQQATIVRPAKEAATVPAKAPGQIVPPTPAPKSKMLVAAATLVVVLIGAGVALYVTHVDQRGRQEPEQAPQSGQSGPTGDQKSRDEKSLDPVAPRDNPTPVPQPRPDDVNPQVQRQAEIAATRTVIDGAMAKDDLDRADRLLADAQRRFDADTFSAQSRELARLRAIKSAQSAIERQAAADKAAAVKAAADKAAADRAAADRAAADKAAADRAAADKAAANKAAADKAAADKAAADKAAADKAAADKVAADKAAAEQAAADRVRQVRGVLDRFAQAYNSKDLAGLAMVWPSVPRESYRSTFNTFESLSWVFNTCDIDVAPATATARCSVALKRVDVRGRVTSESLRRRFVLRNAGGTWRIDEMQIQ
jgi:hypothetical protein